MATVVGGRVDVDDDKPSDRQASDNTDQLGAALGAAAVPMQFRLTDPQVFESFAQHRDISVIAQRCSKQVRAWIEVRS